MALKKKQHYVPQFYLKNFSLRENRKSIRLFNIDANKIVLEASIKDQAYKKYFYDKDNEIENKLNDLETQASAIIAKIVNGSHVPTRGSADHLWILTFATTMRSRTQYAKDEEDEFADKFWKQIFSKDDRYKDDLNLYKFKSENAVLGRLGTTLVNLPICFDLNYKVLENFTKDGFITSDNPVIFYNQFMEIKKAIGGGSGLGIKGLQIFLPLSPNYMILFFDQGVYRIGERKQKIISISRSKDIDVLNYLQCVNAYHNLYFNELSSQEYVEKVFAKSKRYRRQHKMFVQESMIKTEPDGTQSSLIRTRKNEVKINLILSFISLTKKARKYDLGNKIIHFRNEALAEKYLEQIEKFYYGLQRIIQHS